jgi:hypothetical protein
MNHLLEAIADVLLSGFGPRQDGIATRLFVVLTMGIAGICFLILAGFVFARLAVSLAIPLGICFVGLSVLCFWLVSRARRR